MTMTTREPAAIGAAVAAVVNALVLFAGLGLTADQEGAVVVVVTMVAGLFIRSKVSPVA